MIENKNLPMPLRYCKQVVMEIRVYYEDGKSNLYHYFPEKNKWYKKLDELRKRIITLGYSSFNEWKTKWYLGRSKFDLGTSIWAEEFVDTFYSDKFYYTKQEIIRDLIECPEYECDFAIVKKDILDQFMLTRKSEEEKLQKVDWSLVPECSKSLEDIITLKLFSNNEYFEFNTKIRALIIGKIKLPVIKEELEFRKVFSKEERYKIFYKRARSRFGNKFSYNELEYINSDTKITIKCNNCGYVFFQTPRNHIFSTCEDPCPCCGMKKEEVNWEIEIPNIKKLLLENKTYEEIGKLYNRSAHQIGNIIKEYNLEYIQKLRKRSYYDMISDGIGVEFLDPKYINANSRSTEIIERVLNGETVTSISKDLEIKEWWVREFLSRNNISPQKIKEENDKKIVKKIEELAKKEFNSLQIMKELNLSVKNYYTLKRKYNFKIKSVYSKGEFRVYNFLMLNKDKFQKISLQECHEDVLLGSKIKVDFELIDLNGNIIIIEFNGQQHYKFIERFHRTYDGFEKELHRDSELRKYCKEKSILLIEIPYTYNSDIKVNDFLQKTLFDNIDPNTLVDYNSLYKL